MLMNSAYQKIKTWTTRIDFFLSNLHRKQVSYLLWRVTCNVVEADWLNMLFKVETPTTELFSAEWHEYDHKWWNMMDIKESK